MIPELFKRIIEHDDKRPGANEPVVHIDTAHAIRAWRERRNELTVAAKAFVKKQKGG